MADIYIAYGTNPVEMTMDMMERAGVAAKLEKGMRVVIKPNLVVARPAEEGATTHPAIVEGIIRYLCNCGISRITIAEGAWIGDSTARAWKVCGYDRLAERYRVELLDTKRDKIVTKSAQGFRLEVCKSVLDADFLINVPVLKGHCQTNMTCCLKNMKGCIPDSEKRRYHTMGLHKPIAALNTVLRPDLHIVDGICGDLSFEEGGTPIQADRILLGWNGLQLDSYCASLMGCRPEEIGYLEAARSYGLGDFSNGHTEVEEIGKDIHPKRSATGQDGAKRYAKYIREDGACSACYAALIFALHRSSALPKEPVKIGQGFRGKTCSGLGVGSCTARCERHITGCPPRAVDIINGLSSYGE